MICVVMEKSAAKQESEGERETEKERVLAVMDGAGTVGGEGVTRRRSRCYSTRRDECVLVKGHVN